ncbi:NeuroPeptide Receptor family [Trichostrongylus colubriformis]|uniref:NeuroPeptide Receptor family n=1 Tax=Trichostrongylus colubriformis TaxID=6319 RepID=A0AAN8IL70_TRICO
MCSTFILTTLAFDRYMAICHPENKRIHQMRQTLLIISFLVVLSFALIMPVVFSATVRSFPRYGHYVTNSELLVVGFLIVFAFILPCSLLTFFYAKIIIRLRRQQRSMLQSRIPIRRITIYTLAVTLFYLCCQIPFWLPQIYVIVSMVFGYKINPSYITLTYYSHLLPFVSASFNWIFYARLNSQFKKGLILVTERMIRKRARPVQNGSQRDRDNDDLALDLMSKTDDVVMICRSCEVSHYRGMEPSSTTRVFLFSP